ncbi:hypothetical protein NKG94_24140 [Micromonospora sp. M12]
MTGSVIDLGELRHGPEPDPLPRPPASTIGGSGPRWSCCWCSSPSPRPPRRSLGGVR